MFCRSLFVLFLLAIVLSVLLQYTDSDYPFGILKRFFYGCLVFRCVTSCQGWVMVTTIWGRDIALWETRPRIMVRPGAVLSCLTKISPTLLLTTTYAISAYHHSSEFESHSWRSVLDTIICDKVCQWPATSRWCSPGTPPLKLTANWNIVESGVKHHNTNPLER